MCEISGNLQGTNTRQGIFKSLRMAYKRLEKATFYTNSYVVLFLVVLGNSY